MGSDLCLHILFRNSDANSSCNLKPSALFPLWNSAIAAISFHYIRFSYTIPTPLPI